MSKVTSLVGFAVVSLLVVASATQGCGGGSGGPANIQDLCNRNCTKTVACSGGLLTQQQCVGVCTTQAMPNGQRCTNEAAIVTKVNECIGKTECADYTACLQTLPACQAPATGAAGTTGSTGTAGTTGATGAAGSAGTTCATACKKADDCCKALPGADPADCVLQMTCTESVGSEAQVVAICNQVLVSAAGLGASTPAACK